MGTIRIIIMIIKTARIRIVISICLLISKKMLPNNKRCVLNILLGKCSGKKKVNTRADPKLCTN